MTKRKNISYRSEKCLNCNTPLDVSEKYCHFCGQLNSTKKLTILDFLEEFFSNFYAYDSKIRNTFVFLFSKPGFVAKQIVNGKRQTFANPFRLFLSISLLLFITYNLNDSTDLGDKNILTSEANNLNKQLKEQDSINVTIADKKSKISVMDQLGLNQKFHKDSIYTQSDLDNNFLGNTYYRITSFRNYHAKNLNIKTPNALLNLGYEDTRLNQFIFNKAQNFKSNNMRILLVEDEENIRETLKLNLELEGYEVVTVGDGKHVIKTFKDQHFDLILLDINLPDIDGFELCRRLRNNRRTQDTPIIFLTEKRDRVDKLQGLELGVIDYITKPFDIQELRLRVRNAISRAQMPVANNPVTDLPEGELVNEKLGVLMNSSNWAVLKVSINNLGTFREQYGFVAADDVLRAVTLMVRNAVREYGAEDDFVGHLTQESFVIITNDEAAEDIQERIDRRIAQSREYFFPLRDRVKSQEAMGKNNLEVASGVITNDDGPFTELAVMKQALDDAMEVVED